MKKRDGRYRYSPSDLMRFFESPFASWMDRYAEEHPGEVTPDEEDGLEKILQRMGLAHEADAIALLAAKFGEVVRIPIEGSLEEKMAATHQAMKDGAAVIYQGAILIGDFHGYVDFLVKVPGSSNLGDYHYEPWDTKLAKKAKPYFAIQLCCYAELLEALQGRLPSHFTVFLGNKEIESFRIEDFYYFYQELKQRFLTAQEQFQETAKPIPKNSEDLRRWAGEAERYLEKLDHLSLVANISEVQIRKLQQAGVNTFTELANLVPRPIPKLDPLMVARLIRQAQLQKASESTPLPKFEILPHTAGERRGLSLLPPASEGDIYFDLEGYPLAEGGLEYLFGASCLESGKLTFFDWWAHNEEEEKLAFETFVDWAYAKWRKHPDMHIYHYGSYEISALRKHMGKYGTREEEVDNFLRSEVFVNLLTIVTQGMLLGEPRYSLKNVEKVFGFTRGSQVALASDSVVAYADWLEHPDGPDWRSSAKLKDIRDYNEEDVVATAGLAQWLREQQGLNGIAYIPFEPDIEDVGKEAAPSESLKIANELVASSLIEDTPAEVARVRALLGHLVQFHKRENKPMWWSYYDRLGKVGVELIEDPDCLAGLTRSDTPPTKVKRSFLYEYHFDPSQETKLKAGKQVAFVHNPDELVTIETLDRRTGLLTFTMGTSRTAPPLEIAVVPYEYLNASPIDSSILSIAKGCAAAEELSGVSKALRDFLLRTVPDITDHAAGTPLIAEGNDILDEVSRIVKAMNDTTICIQGPPGTGKTHTSAHAIIQLLKQKKKVGITGNSHKVIDNLMEKVRELSDTETGLKGLKICSTADQGFLERNKFAHTKGGKEAFAGTYTECNLVGGTAWAFSHENAIDTLDYLFVDEAGQVSTANLVGMSRSTKNIVLIGDQMQLEQPGKAVHPGDSGKSCLKYYLQNAATIPPEQGIFLGRTRRLHPALCTFISDSFYEGRLTPLPENESRTVVLCGDHNEYVKRNAGVLFLSVNHQGNSQSSEEEAELILKVVGELTKCSIPRGASDKSPLTLADILFVAPYNMQVRTIEDKLGPEAQVGSVDLFQGQEAAVVILSLCSSSGELSPRGLDFILNPNRLNVAISRAQSLAIVVGSPSLSLGRCSNLEQMRLLNQFCKIKWAGRCLTI